MVIISRLLNSVVFWAAWVIIPVLMEIVPSIGSMLLLAKRHVKRNKDTEELKVYPELSIIVPVYNSEATLFGCIKSINDCNYPNDRMRIFLVNNKGKDDSFSVFAQCQKEFPELRMQWLNSQQGKSKALNLALYNSTGKYIINLDSDGMLEKNALNNMIDKFEDNPELNCMTGAILTEPGMIEEYKKFFPRLLRKLEFMEYAQAFLAGRSYASENDSVYTLSGAFSAFRKSAVLKSQMYNTDTICEDTQITFQMKYFYKERVEVCEDALYFVDPIEGVNKLYTQRQRWQRGSLEVAKMFSGDNFKLSRMFKDINIKTLVYDHTFAFPRMIWYLALICLLCMNYSSRAIILASGIIMIMYICIGYFYFLSTQYFLKPVPEVRKYYCKQWWVVALLPLFNLVVFFIRVAGIINSINTDSAWKTRDLKDERNELSNTLRKDLDFVLSKLDKVKAFANGEKIEAEANEQQAVEAEIQEEQAVKEAAVTTVDSETVDGDRKSIGWHITIGLVYVISVLILVVCHWVYKTYGVGLNELISTLTLSIKGASSEVTNLALKSCLPPVIIAVVVFVLTVIIDRIRMAKPLIKVKKFVQRIMAIGAVVVFFVSVVYVNSCFDVVGYFKTSVAQSKLYDDYYVPPESVAITADGKTKNLIYIYIESLETTYASKDVGGNQGTNYIPNLTKLAQDNISFSSSDKLGGFHSTYGTGITMGALFGTTSGAAYSLGTEVNEMLAGGNFLSGITTMGDVLEEKGYKQMFLCGSDGDFGGRKTYFEQHGNYEVFDLYSAREAGYIPDDYFVWWGYEDVKLYEIAKKELSKMADGDEPFNFTMLTVDPHHMDGYVCEHCKNDYDNITANVMTCTDTLLKNFVDWCKTQDFYEDSVIIISGDHPRMDTSLVEGVSYYDRTIYNCFINSVNDGTYNDKNRVYTPMDMFPTVLSAMGFNIEGDRLGLGTNMFSDKKTLAEEKGFEWLDTELSKSSSYYYDKFAPELK
ncbi:MAG: putative glycosyltransferase, exosortase G system-associated [Lachnospira sp.]|nr:putative glycosyltransferase, exosortase G system-associated [Lachnospira sp.]